MQVSPPSPTAVAAALRRHLKRPIDVTQVQALSAGAASDTFAVDALDGGDVLPLILQRAPNTGPVDGAMSKRLLAEVQSRMFDAGLPVAQVLCALDAEDHLGDGYVMARLEGETLAGRYLRDDAYAHARAQLTRQTAQALANLHALDPAKVKDLPLRTASPVEQIGLLDGLYRSFGAELPVFDLAVSWLKRHQPQGGRTALVHGDFRSGNFIVDHTGLVAVLDWELAHLGDPQEDLGWICVNSWRFGHWQKPVGGFGERDDFYAAYEAAGGAPVDRAATLFWEVLGTLRWGVSCLQLAHQHLSGQVLSVERAAIGRRVSEVEIDLLQLLETGAL
jgi:aminoglycoside phosphotransferase (APT) family kinase protein